MFPSRGLDTLDQSCRQFFLPSHLILLVSISSLQLLTPLAIARYEPSQADVQVYKAVGSASTAQYPHVARWYSHIKSWESEHPNLAGSSTAAAAFIGGAAAAAPEGGDDDEVDLFGSDDEEDDAEAERLKAERVAAYNAKKALKPKTVAKVHCSSTTVLFSSSDAPAVCRHPRRQALGR